MKSLILPIFCHLSTISLKQHCTIMWQSATTITFFAPFLTTSAQWTAPRNKFPNTTTVSKVKMYFHSLDMPESSAYHLNSKFVSPKANTIVLDHCLIKSQIGKHKSVDLEKEEISHSNFLESKNTQWARFKRRQISYSLLIYLDLDNVTSQHKYMISMKEQYL